MDSEERQTDGMSEEMAEENELMGIIEKGQEGQGSDLLSEFARIELQAAVGNQLVDLLKIRFGELALDSPGNLRLARHLLNLRAHDESGYEGDEMGEEWVELVEDADDSLRLMSFWELLLDAEEATKQSAVADHLKLYGVGRVRALAQMEAVFKELEIRLGGYKVQNRLEGKRMTEEIVEFAVESTVVEDPDREWHADGGD